MIPETRYARAADGTHVAFQVSGSGSIDVVIIRAWYSDMEHEWQEPVLARMYRRMGSIARLIRLDRRGMGMSDRVTGQSTPTLEQGVDDIRAVLDAAGSSRAVLVGFGDGSTNCALFAATHPTRTAALVLYAPFLRWLGPTEDYPGGETEETHVTEIAALREGWGTPGYAARTVATGAPSRATDERLIAWLAEQQARAGSAEDAVRMAEWFWATDATTVLPAIHVPTLVIARSHAPGIDEARYTASRVDGARLVELPGEDIFALAGDTDAVLREIERFVEAMPDHTASDTDDSRVLATVLFTDIVDSTRRAAELGDRGWSDVVERHNLFAAGMISRHRGRLVDTAGDGILAAFDGPGRAIRCARSVVEGVRELGLEVRAGLHTGECEQVGHPLRGLAVHIGARVAALARPSEVLVSSTVKDLVAGSGFAFENRGEHELKGVPERWRLFSVR